MSYIISQKLEEIVDFVTLILAFSINNFQPYIFYNMANQQFKDCIDACVSCAVACSYCAIECLNEENVGHLTKCIQLDLECAALCRSAAEVMSLGGSFSAHLCRVCADSCNACAEECEKHAQMGMDHCRKCAEACRHCADICEGMATAV